MSVINIFRKTKKSKTANFEKFNNIESILKLIELTHSKNGNERRLAASSLGKLSKFTPDIFEAVPYLIKLLDDEKPQVRQYAIKASGKIGDTRAISGIRRLLDDNKYYTDHSLNCCILKKASNIQIYFMASM